MVLVKIQDSELEPEMPRPNRLNLPGLSQQVLNITVTQVESVIHPDGVTDDVGWESMTFVGIHPEIIHFRELTCQHPINLSR